MERTQFTFYRSFWVAMRSLPKRDRLPFIEAICAYVFEGETRELSGGAAAAFFLVSPVLNTACKRAESGKQNANKPKTNRKQTEDKMETKRKPGLNEGENEIEKEIEKEDECPPPDPPQEGGRRSRRGGNIFAEMLREGVEG